VVFSSVTFVFYFLPLVLVAYLLLPARNIVLLFASLVFYAWGETYFIAVLMVSIGLNYLFGILIEKSYDEKRRTTALFLGLGADLGLLCLFKYLNFIADNLNVFLSTGGYAPIEIHHIHLPLGISFFTFQAMSYLVDVYRRTVPAERNIFNLGLYIAMFPQLVAGPIVRFNQIADQLHKRSVTTDAFSLGVRRFVVGLGQKMLIANILAVPADAIFAVPSEGLTPAIAWLGVVAYTLQIYFDFAGYSNMAIGLGHMFGFTLPENFNYPYIAQSITEFWRRWHISLSRWFRDYLYIPLGGNRKGSYRTYANLFVVFFLCGLWHGASWNFVVWGLFHGFFLVVERVGLGAVLERLAMPFRHVYSLMVILCGWVIFRSETLTYAGDYLAAMAGRSAGDGMLYSAHQYLTREVMVILVVGIIGSAPVVPFVRDFLQRACASRMSAGGHIIQGSRLIVFTGLLLLIAMSLASQTHNPFIYFRF